MSYLAERYGKKSHLVSGWILGNEIGNTREWNYGGKKSLSAYMDNYVRTFRIVNTAVRSVNKNAHVYLSLDYHWNYDPDGDGKEYFSSKAILNTFYKKLKAQGKVDWYIAYHAYSQGLMPPEFWDDTMATDSVDSQLVNFKNLNILTNYVKKHFGSKVKVMLSEQSFTVDKGEMTQAAAYAYAYYKSEANGMIEAFIYGRHVDNAAELSPGGAMIRWGLKSNTGARRFIWDVYQYIDSPDSLQITKNLIGYVNGLSSWKKVPGLSTKKFSKMPSKRKKITGFSAVSASNKSIKLSWERCATATGYQIYRSTSKDGTYKLIHGIPADTQTSYTDTGLTTGKTYYYKIRMYKAVPGGGMLAGSQVMASAMVTVGQTSINSVTAGEISAKLSWKSVTAADGYYVYRSLSKDSGYARIAAVAGQKTTTYTDTVEAGRRYYYKVAAYVQISGTVYQGELSQAASAVPKPLRPSITQLTPGAKRIGVQWERIPNAEGYQVYSSRTKDGKYVKQTTVTDGAVCSYVHDPDYTGQEYYYKVRAFVKVDDKIIYSEFSDLACATAYSKELTIETILRDENGKAVLSWKKNEAAFGYQIVKSEAEDGTYTPVIDQIPSTGEDSYTFTDDDSRTDAAVYYKIRIYEINSAGITVYGEWSKAYRAEAWEEPGTEEPGTEEPGTEEPGTEEPGTEEPGTEEPGTEKPGTEEPGTEDPGTEEPGTEEPGTKEPGTEVSLNYTNKMIVFDKKIV